MSNEMTNEMNNTKRARDYEAAMRAYTISAASLMARCGGVSQPPSVDGPSAPLDVPLAVNRTRADAAVPIQPSDQRLEKDRIQ